jgi:hypothetical protein
VSVINCDRWLLGGVIVSLVGFGCSSWAVSVAFVSYHIQIKAIVTTKKLKVKTFISHLWEDMIYISV